MWATILSASSNVIFSSAVFTVQGLFRSTRQKQRSRPNPSKGIFQGGFREAQVICLQRGFQSGTDLAIHGNSRKKNPGFKSRRIIILSCTFAKPWARIRRKTGFSSTGRLNKAQLKNFGLPPVQSAMDLDRSHKMSFFHTGSTATCWARTAASRAVLQGGKRPGASSCVFSGTCRVAGLITARRLPRGKAQELPAPPQWLLPEEIFHTAPTSKVGHSGRDMHADVAQPGRGRAGWFSA